MVQFQFGAANAPTAQPDVVLERIENAVKPRITIIRYAEILGMTSLSAEARTTTPLATRMGGCGVLTLGAAVRLVKVCKRKKPANRLRRGLYDFSRWCDRASDLPDASNSKLNEKATKKIRQIETAFRQNPLPT
jgi:hypothetical protein